MGDLTKAFDNPVPPLELRERLNALEEETAYLRATLEDEIQRRRMAERILLSLRQLIDLPDSPLRKRSAVENPAKANGSRVT